MRYLKVELIDIDQVQYFINFLKESTVSEDNFKDPYSIRYFLGFLLVMLIPTLPATLTLINVFS